TPKGVVWWLATVVACGDELCIRAVHLLPAPDGYTQQERTAARRAPPCRIVNAGVIFIVHLKLKSARQIRGSMEGTWRLGHRRRYVQPEQSIEFKSLVEMPGDQVYLRNCSSF